MYIYLYLHLATLAYPMAQSFERRLKYWRKWKALFPGIAVGLTIFIIWDILFTEAGFWGFNPEYLIGVDLLGLPIEEWLFFVTVPYACIFIYECVIYFIPKDILSGVKMPIGVVFMLGSATMAIVFYDQWYTTTAFGFLALVLAVNLFVLKSVWMGRFFIAWAIAAIPFFLVNGVLTGSWIEGEVVWYNDAENLGIRIGTIPFEDYFYGMGLMLIDVTIYEILLKRWTEQPTEPQVEQELELSTP